jgi:hypothetical protein
VGDFFAFRRMIAPVLIHIFYWVGSLALLAVGVLMAVNKFDLVTDRIPEPTEKSKDFNLKQWTKSMWDGLDEKTRILVGIAVAIGGPFFIRIYSELMMLPFRINDTLTDIRNVQKPHPAPITAPAAMPRR